MACQNEEKCPIADDLFPIYTKMKAADAIILTSPVYYGSAIALLKALMERTGYIATHNGRPFEGKVGGPFVVAHRSSQYFTSAQLSFWFHVQGFFMPGSIHSNISFGRDKGDVENDLEGVPRIVQYGGPWATVPELLFEKKGLIPALQYMLISYSKT